MFKAPKGYPYSDEEFNEGIALLLLLFAAGAGVTFLAYVVIDIVISIVKVMM